jgi:hypothetical protein
MSGVTPLWVVDQDRHLPMWGVCAVVCVCTVVWKRAIYVRHFLGFVEALPNIAIPHVVDNSALPALTENMGVSRKTEHFRRWQHFIGVTL